MYPDSEIHALSDVYDELKGLNNSQIQRIIDWINSKFELDKYPGLKAKEREETLSPAPAPAAEPSRRKAAAPVIEPVKKRRGRRPAKEMPVEEKPVPQPVPQAAQPAQPAAEPGITPFSKYEDFEELLLFSQAKTNSAKILLAAAFLQEKKNYKEFSSYDITSLFKSIKEEVSQPSTALNNLMSKNPPMLLLTGTQGPGLKARRNFRVTEEGLRIARNYIKE
jgi:hypothetical protein